MARLVVSNFPLKFYKCRSGVPDPIFATDGAACFDMHMVTTDVEEVLSYNSLNEKSFLVVDDYRSVNIPPGWRALLPTGLIFDIPQGFSVRLHDRSGNALKSGLVCSNSEGVIDSDYVKEVFFMVRNVSDVLVTVENMVKICQGEMVSDLGYSLKQTMTPPVRNNVHDGFGSTDAK